MVNLLGMDITEGAENGKPAGTAFIVRQADSGQAAKLFEYQEKYTETEQKAGLPPLLALLKSAFWLGWVIPGCAIIEAGGFADGCAANSRKCSRSRCARRAVHHEKRRAEAQESGRIFRLLES